MIQQFAGTKKKVTYSLLHVSPGPCCVPGIVNSLSVPAITGDTTRDEACVALSLLKNHPTLQKARLKKVSPACMSLRAANGSPLEVLGFVSMQITLGEISRLVDALVILLSAQINYYLITQQCLGLEQY